MNRTTSKKCYPAAAVLALALGTLSLGAQATPVIFFGLDATGSGGANLATQPNSDAVRNSFFTNLIGVGTETFESYTLGTSAPLVLSFGSAGTATLTGAGSLRGSPPTVSNQYGIGNSKYWFASTGNFTINFSAPIAAFGFYAITLRARWN